MLSDRKRAIIQKYLSQVTTTKQSINKAEVELDKAEKELKNTIKQLLPTTEYVTLDIINPKDDDKPDCVANITLKELDQDNIKTIESIAEKYAIFSYDGGLILVITDFKENKLI